MIALLVLLAISDVRVVELQPQHTIVTTVRTKPEALASQITNAVVTLMTTADQYKVEIDGPPFARYRTRTAKEVDVEIGMPIKKAPEAKKLGKSVRVVDLPGGRAAELVYIGRHEDLPKANADLDAWLAREGKKPLEPRWEIYETNPITTPDPAAQKTRIVVRLAPDSR